MGVATCLTRGERAVVAALADAMAAPAPPLPPVRETDTVDAFDAWLAASPALNRVGLRATLLALALLPLALGQRRRFTGLDRAARTSVLRRVERSRAGHGVLRALSGIVIISYYGDAGVMGLLGYDADANVSRGRRLIAKEARTA